MESTRDERAHMERENTHDTASRMGMTRRRFIEGAAATSGLALLSLAGLTGCGSDAALEDAGADSSSSSSGDTFTYAIAGDPGNTVNVITTSDRFGLMTIKMVYSPLYMYNADGINYFLAKSYELSDDGLTITMHLRDDVSWSDGEKFTADDVVFTYETMEQEANAGWAYSQLVDENGVVKVTKVDDVTVTMTFPALNAAAVEMVGNIFIMPKHVYEGTTDFENNDLNMKAVGTGPYVMDEYSAGSYLSFKANESYFLGAPSIPTFVFRVIEEENTAMTAIQSGEVTAWIATPPQVEQMSLDENNLEQHPYPEGRVAYMDFNARRVGDQRVRQAILYALDKVAIADGALLSSEYYDLPWSFLPPSSEFASTDCERYEQDTDRAKQLLSDAGVDPASLSLTLAYSGSDSLQSTCAVLMQEQLKSIGVTLTLQGVDATALAQQMKDEGNGYDMYYGGYIMGIDPDTFSSLFVSGEAYNYMHYDEPEIDALFKQGHVETDHEKRVQIYEEIQQKLQDTAYFYPLYSNKRILITSKSVSGIDDGQLVPVYTFEDASKLSMS
jgi:peptide/nickel transport system substrate-binding protein